MNYKHTTHPLASLAARTLQDPNASEVAKSLAGSTLSQVDRQKETGKIMETLASNVLKSPKYSTATKELAGSVLSQSDKRR
jgi:hypothetical protein